MEKLNWYEIENIEHIDSPTLAVYPDRIRENIKTFVAAVEHPGRLRPHVKTHKSAEVAAMMFEAGITKFKCATIAEAEMLANAGAQDILLAYQPVGPKAARLLSLTKQYPSIRWSCLLDDPDAARRLSEIFEGAGGVMRVFIDLNVGMNRTGITPEVAPGLIEDLLKLNGIEITGLHAYDGHLRDADFELRKRRCDEAFEGITLLQRKVEERTGRRLTVVAGGSPTFSIHCMRKDVECSPGTFVYWDKGYGDGLREQRYQYAALVISRVVSLPSENMICTDLGHKAIASENPLGNRVHFLNAPELEPVSHSEEHMVFKVPHGAQFRVGDVLYGVPFHICPTVALHDVAHVVVDGRAGKKWAMQSRNRKISI